MASNRSKSPAKAKTRPALTFDMAVQLCPHQGMAEKVAESFGLIVPEYDAIREEHARALRLMWTGFGDSLNEKATEMHFQRIVGSLVASAVGGGRFFSTKVSEARAATARAGDGGDDEYGTLIGLESKAQRIREFAADMIEHAVEDETQSSALGFSDQRIEIRVVPETPVDLEMVHGIVAVGR